MCGVDVCSSLRLCLLSNSFGSAAEWHRCSNLNVSYSWLMKFNIIKTRNFHFYVFCLLFFGSTTKWHRCSNLNVSYKLTSEVQHYQNRNFYFNVFCFGLVFDLLLQCFDMDLTQWKIAKQFSAQKVTFSWRPIIVLYLLAVECSPDCLLTAK